MITWTGHIRVCVSTVPERAEDLVYHRRALLAESVFDPLRVAIGPSGSPVVGPMAAAHRFACGLIGR
ncbi:serine dehydratase beta chain [Nonomuraea sp. CA-143628]|uniref:serine dehydratase beta chain n=1 Tax=Nonomuraea sp. CA-143628 TaxID=3239997 RepID=UPI003D8FA471